MPLHQNDPTPLVLQCQTPADTDDALAIVLVFLSTSHGLAIR